MPASAASPVDVEQVVLDLEGEAEIGRVGAEHGAGRLAGSAEDRARLAGEGEQRAGLEALQLEHLVEAEGPALGLEVDHLAAAHPERAGGDGELSHQAAAHRSLGVGRGVGQQLEGQALQGVADQDRGRLVEPAVARRPAAPGQRVVHRRQVVVDQGIAVDQLDRHADPERARRRDREQLGSGHDQERPQPLAAAQHGVAHRLVQPGLRVPRRRQQTVELDLDRVGDRRHVLRERRHGAGQAESSGSLRALPSGPSVIRSTLSFASLSLRSQCSLSAVPRS